MLLGMAQSPESRAGQILSQYVVTADQVREQIKIIKEKPAPKKKAPAKKAAAKRKPNAAFMKPMTPSAALGAVIGASAMPRTEVTKKI